MALNRDAARRRALRAASRVPLANKGARLLLRAQVAGLAAASKGAMLAQWSRGAVRARASARLPRRRVAPRARADSLGSLGAQACVARCAAFDDCGAVLRAARAPSSRRADAPTSCPARLQHAARGEAAGRDGRDALQDARIPRLRAQRGAVPTAGRAAGGLGRDQPDLPRVRARGAQAPDRALHGLRHAVLPNEHGCAREDGDDRRRARACDRRFARV